MGLSKKYLWNVKGPDKSDMQIDVVDQDSPTTAVTLPDHELILSHITAIGHLPHKTPPGQLRIPMQKNYGFRNQP